MPRPIPLLRLLVRRGQARDQEEARALVERGRVRIDGLPARNPAARVRPDKPVEVLPDVRRWVSRGARKLLGALADLPMEVAGHTAADLGASTGGFTEVLLHRGARHVYAVDVGRGLLHRSLVVDPRVTVWEGTNVRTLECFPEPVTRIVGDLSFISLRAVLPAIERILEAEGEALLLVKPQFEAERSEVRPGGVLDEEARLRAIEGVLGQAQQRGWEILGHRDSRLPGARSGNIEHFVWMRPPSGTVATPPVPW